MKKSEFRQLIREEIRKVINEAVTIDPALQAKLKIALAARKRDPEDENAHDAVENILMQIYKKAGRKDAKELAAGSMEDEVTMTGPLSAVLSLVKDTVAELDSYSGSAKSTSIKIKEPSGDFPSAIIDKTAMGSEITHANNKWKYSYAGSPMDMIKDLMNANGIRKVGSSYREVSSKDPLLALGSSIVKAIQSNPKFKKAK